LPSAIRQGRPLRGHYKRIAFAGVLSVKADFTAHRGYFVISGCLFQEGSAWVIVTFYKRLLFGRGGGASLLGAAVVVGLPEYV
jgi:hypothetical protein